MCKRAKVEMAKPGRRRIFPSYLPKFNGKHPISVAIGHEKFEVRSWKEVFLKTCQVVRVSHPNDFQRVLKLKGYKKSWFSREPKQLRDPIRITGTSIFAEANQNANSLVLRSLHVLNFFGMEPAIDVKIKETW
jgi:hypothetical protein